MSAFIGWVIKVVFGGILVLCALAGIVRMNDRRSQDREES